MSPFEWCLVIGINGAIILFGLVKSRETKKSVDWFLAARGLPWWMIGLSMFATAVDSGDYVAVAGESYRSGMGYISSWWLGITIGWLVVAYVVFLPMYRMGMFTNAEYLEHRFGPITRLASVFIQIQYRTNVLANVAYSLYLTFSLLTGWGTETWWLVVAIALGAAVYTAAGGLKSVVVTDAMQSVVMLAASFTLWWAVWSAVGGWDGIDTRLEQAEAGLSAKMLHVGGGTEPGTPAWLMVVGWIIVLTAYCVVNHSQAMRMLAARSEWDVKMSAVLAGTVTAGVMWFNVTLGIMGRALYPTIDQADKLFPLLVEQFLVPMQSGLAGLVIAGLIAGGISTYDSIGSSLAAVFTRDLYARFLVKQADDRHYLTVSRISTVVVIAVSFFYIPYLESGMVKFYLKLTGVAVVPLLAVYLMGILTRVHRASGTIGLLVGILCGLSRFITVLPVWWTNTWWGYLWSLGTTSAAMIVTTLVLGRANKDELRGLTLGSQPPETRSRPLSGKATWLETSQAEVPHMPVSPFDETRWYHSATMWTVLLLVTLAVLNLIVFW